MKIVLNFIRHVWTASIRRQLMLGIILVHAVLMSIFIFDLVERQRVFLHEQSVQQTKSLSKTIAANSSSWVLANDVIGLEEIVVALQHYPALRYAMILSPDGRVLGHTDLDKVGLYINDKLSEKLLKSKKEQQLLVSSSSSIDVASPVMINDQFIGWAWVSLNQKENVAELSIITRNGILYMLLAIVVGVLFAFYMSKGITRDLQHIVDVAEHVKHGNFQIRTKLDRSDELGQLSEDFNLMLDTINKNKRDLQAIMNESPAIIYVKDLDGRFTFINRKFLNLYNMKSQDVIGKTLHELFDKDIADAIKQNDLDVMETGHTLESEEVAPHADGVLHTYVSNKFPLYDDEGKIYAVCGISTDMTDRIKIEKEKTALEYQLQHAQKIQAIGQLTGGIAHDFNNLLSVVLGFAELSKDKYGQLDENLSFYLGEIYTAGIRGRDLVKQMMLYSRKDEGSNDEITSMSLEPVIYETVTMLQSTFPSTIKISTSINVNTPNVKYNSSLMSQVLINLCINAKDSLQQQGEIKISLSTENFKPTSCSSCFENLSGQYVVVSIADNGTGIEDNILNRIFEPFFTSKNIGEGTGMGLSVVHGIVHKMGGHILVNSIVGEGTEFKIIMPASNDNTVIVEEKRNNGTEFNFSQLKIMVIDDEPAVASFMAEAISAVGAEVEIFNDSQLAYEDFKARPSHFDLVITDQTMPSLTGMALSKSMLEINPDISIILCTGYSVEVTEEETIKYGIKSFMMKPVKMNNLFNIIKELKLK